MKKKEQGPRLEVTEDYKKFTPNKFQRNIINFKKRLRVPVVFKIKETARANKAKGLKQNNAA